MTKICPNCGKQLNIPDGEAAWFCPACNTPFMVDEDVNETNASLACYKLMSKGQYKNAYFGAQQMLKRYPESKDLKLARFDAFTLDMKRERYTPAEMKILSQCSDAIASREEWNGARCEYTKNAGMKYLDMLGTRMNMLKQEIDRPNHAGKIRFAIIILLLLGACVSAILGSAKVGIIGFPWNGILPVGCVMAISLYLILMPKYTKHQRKFMAEQQKYLEDSEIVNWPEDIM